MAVSSIPKTGPVSLKIAIAPELGGQRLDKALTLLAARRVPALSRARLQALIGQGHVLRAGKPVTDASRKAKAGEIYVVHLPPPEPAAPEAQSMPLQIVYEDNDLLVIDKPAGLVVHPAPGNRDRTLVNALLAHCGKSLSGIGGVARPGIVHRLDKDTSGLIVVAKNDRAHQALTRQFADRSLSRTYRAVVWGVPHPPAGSIEAPIGRHPRDRKKMAVVARGKPALTHYKVLESFDLTVTPAKAGVPFGSGKKKGNGMPACAGMTKASLVECKLSTGRTHQIRVHFAHRKHPLVGDPVYGARRQPESGRLAGVLRAFPRQALHAAVLQFRHPRNDKPVRFASTMPEDMEALLQELRGGK